MQYTHQNRRAPCHPAGESRKSPLRVDFDRRLKLEFHGSKITSDAGLLTYRELDDALGLTEVAGTIFQDSRTGKNGWHGMTAPFRQSVFGRLGGYEDVNDADRLGRDPAMRWIVGGKAVERQAASSSQMGRFETALLATDANIEALADMNGVWIDRVHDRRPPKMIILDMDSSVSPTHGEQEGAAYNGSAAPAIIPFSCSTSLAIWNGVPFALAMSTALMVGVRFWNPSLSVTGNGACAATSEEMPPLPCRIFMNSWKVRITNTSSALKPIRFFRNVLSIF